VSSAHCDGTDRDPIAPVLEIYPTTADLLGMLLGALNRRIRHILTNSRRTGSYLGGNTGRSLKLRRITMSMASQRPLRMMGNLIEMVSLPSAPRDATSEPSIGEDEGPANVDRRLCPASSVNHPLRVVAHPKQERLFRVIPYLQSEICASNHVRLLVAYAKLSNRHSATGPLCRRNGHPAECGAL
jgi:hypothetical protein